MAYVIKTLFTSALVALFVVNITPVQAEKSYLIAPVVSYATVRFNNENWHTLPHPEVAEFTVQTDGSAFGRLVTGVPFYQYNVPNDLGIRVQRFEIDDHYHYIVDGEIAYTMTDLSIKLAAAYNAMNVAS